MGKVTVLKIVWKTYGFLSKARVTECTVVVHIVVRAIERAIKRFSCPVSLVLNFETLFKNLIKPFGGDRHIKALLAVYSNWYTYIQRTGYEPIIPVLEYSVVQIHVLFIFM